MAKQKKRGSCGTILIALIVLGVIGGIFVGDDEKDDSPKNTLQNESVENVASSEEITETQVAQKETQEVSSQNEGVTGIEVRKESDYGVIEDFDYEIVGNTVKLDSYDGNADILEICTSYVIDGTEYMTDISDFQIGIGDSDVRTVIFDEGFTEVANAVFNSTDVQNVFFPKSMINVYDNTLSYLHPEDNDKVRIYYAGTQEEWLNIFTEYKRTKVEDAWESKDAEAVGAAVADKLNELIGSGYDSSEFEYFFSANPDDLK